MYGRYRFTWDFYVLGFDAFDFLLGADWLKNFETNISCKERTVSLKNDKGIPLLIECKHPQDFAGSFIFSLDWHLSELSSTPVVQHFPDVFGEVTPLPPHQEIEFQIDLIPGALPKSSRQEEWHLMKKLN